ncbi:MAG: hypothetical protein Tsb009_15730 [Planctomycetaceae bacterium]
MKFVRPAARLQPKITNSEFIQSLNRALPRQRTMGNAASNPLFRLGLLHPLSVILRRRIERVSG